MSSRPTVISIRPTFFPNDQNSPFPAVIPKNARASESRRPLLSVTSGWTVVRRTSGGGTSWTASARDLLRTYSRPSVEANPSADRTCRSRCGKGASMTHVGPRNPPFPQALGWKGIESLDRLVSGPGSRIRVRSETRAARQVRRAGWPPDDSPGPDPHRSSHDPTEDSSRRLPVPPARLRHERGSSSDNRQCDLGATWYARGRARVLP